LAATSLEETAAALPPTAPAGGRSTQNLVARYGLALSQALPQRQRFQQADYAKVYRRNLNSPPLPEVLREFQLEQTSGRIRIVDADGSVYLGQVMDLSELPTLSRDAGLMPSDGFRPDLRPTGAALAPARAAPAGSAAARAPATAGTEFPLTAETAREVVFSATGTNRSLNQRVVFQGRLTTTNATAGEPRGLPAKAVQDFTYQGLQGWLSNSILRGRATVGRTQVEINARPVPGP
jgi:hypothetical protein